MFTQLIKFAILCTVALGQQQEGEGTAGNDVSSEDSCEPCRFYPTVCNTIDFCIDSCNIAPSMRESCQEDL
jgi:hypothetical protein